MAYAVKIEGILMNNHLFSIGAGTTVVLDSGTTLTQIPAIIFLDLKKHF
jgi:hypothetical protein